MGMVGSGCYLLLMAGSLWAQEFSFRTYTPEDGLSHNTVYSAFQDEQGFLWFGTYESVDRFDGRRFHNPLAEQGIQVNRVRGIGPDRLGGFWLATHAGAIHINQGQPTLYDRSTGLADDSTYRVLRDAKDRLWIATAGGLQLQLQDGSFQLFTTEHGLPHNIVRNLLEDETGVLWAGTQAGLALFDGYGFQPMTLPIQGQVGIYGMALDHWKRLWISSDQGLFCFDQNSWHHFGEEHGLPSLEVWSLCLDRFGSLWAGTDRGAAFADLTGDDFPHLTFASPGHQDVATTTIYAIEEDNEGNLWFGTCIGLFQLREPALRHYEFSTLGAGSMVLSIAEDRENRLWYGTDQGVVVRDGDSLTNLTPSLQLPDLFVRSLLPTENGGMWFGTRRGALFRRGEESQLLNRASGLADEHILALYQASDDSLYIGTLRGGLGVSKGGQLSIYDEDDGLTANRVYSICDDGEGGVWIGTESGVNRLSPNGLSQLSLTLPGKEVSALLRDRRGRLWIGTNRCVATLEDGQPRLWLANQGGPEGACRFIAEDPAGAVWVGTTNGVWRLTDSGSRRFDGAAWTPREMNFGAWTLDHSGRLWFGHFAGVLQADPKRVMTDIAPPPIMLTGISIYDRARNPTPGLVLDYKQNQPGFQFTGLSFRAPDQLGYEYRLEGYDHDWLANTTGQVTYPALDPGRYTFRVRARDRDGTVSQQPASLGFRIKPPFWQSLWFRILLVLGILLLAVSQIQHLRLRNRVLANETAYLATQVEKEQVAKLQQEAELKLLHSQMNPHFLQNAFTSAIYFVKSSPEKAEQMLSKLSSLFSKSMQAKRQVWSTVADERLICINYLEIQKLRFGDRLQYSLSCSPHLDPRPIPGFVLQPLVENAVLHGLREMVDQLTVAVTFSERENQAIYVSVANTGQPLDQSFASLVRPGHALDNINQRLDLLGFQALIYAYENGRHEFTLAMEAARAHHLGR